VENRNEYIEAINIQIQFLILEKFEHSDLPVKYNDLFVSVHSALSKFEGFSDNKEGFVNAFAEMTYYLCGQGDGESKILFLDENNSELSKAEDFEAQFAYILRYLEKHFDLDLNADDALFHDSYKKLKAPDCLIPESRQSMLLYYMIEYLCPNLNDNKTLTVDTQLEYLALREIYKWEQANAKKKSKPGDSTGISVPEIVISLKENKVLWYARNLELDDAVFDTKIQDILTRVENLRSEIYQSGYVKVDSVKELINLYSGQKTVEDKPFEITYTKIIDNYKKWHTWRIAGDFQMYYSLLLQRLAGELEVQINYIHYEEEKTESGELKQSESDEPEMIFNSHSWSYILTGNDVAEFSTYFLPEQQVQKESHNKEQTHAINPHINQEELEQYILERNRVWEDPKSGDQLYAIRVKDYNAIKEQVYFVLKKYSGVKTVLPEPVELSDTGKIVSLKSIGEGIGSSALRPIIDALEKKSESLPIYYTCERIGWEKEAFIGSSIIEKGAEYQLFNSAYITDPNRKALESAGDLSTWVDLCNDTLKSSIPAQAVIAAAFSSAIVGALKAGSIIVNLNGDPGSGKSTVQKLATSIWSRTDDLRIAMSFNGTPLGLLQAMNNNSGVSVSIDDQSMGDESPDKYIGFVYKLEEGLSRRSASKNNTLSSWHTSIILSSETSILECHDKTTRGVLRRMFEFPIKHGILTRDADQALKIKNVTKENYGLAGPEFVRFLLKHDNLSQLQDKYDQQLEKVRKSTEDQRGSAQSMAERIATILLTCDLVHDALGLSFDTDKVSEYLQDVVRRALMSDVSREEAIKILQKILPDIKAASIHPNDTYYHVPVPDFNRIESANGYSDRALRKILSQYGLTKENKTGSSHNITENGSSIKVISILKEVD
jgi:hypothetical protein